MQIATDTSVIMKLLNLLSLAGLAAACAHEHDDKEWTKEELDELEAKWGYEVCESFQGEKLPMKCILT